MPLIFNSLLGTQRIHMTINFGRIYILYKTVTLSLFDINPHKGATDSRFITEGRAINFSVSGTFISLLIKNVLALYSLANDN